MIFYIYHFLQQWYFIVIANASTTQMGVFIENRDLSYFSFRFNPIFSDGATSILMALEGTPLKR